MEAHTIQPDIPLPPADAQLLDALLLARFDLHALVERFELTASQLLDWAASPAIQSRLRILQDFADQCFDLRASTARAIAADALDRVAAGPDALESRRAAAALIRVRRTRPLSDQPTHEAPPTIVPEPVPPSSSDDSEVIPAPVSPPRFIELLHAAMSPGPDHSSDPGTSPRATAALAAAAGSPSGLGNHAHATPRDSSRAGHHDPPLCGAQHPPRTAI